MFPNQRYLRPENLKMHRSDFSTKLSPLQNYGIMRLQGHGNNDTTVPVGRMGRPEDVAQALVFLIQNSFMTGTIIDCDGGARIK
jgi:NAD(P)-dependent dehydrogenase (short-subunit alcohol dehydrogenase family)